MAVCERVALPPVPLPRSSRAVNRATMYETKIRLLFDYEFITLGDSAVAEFVTEVFLCTYEAYSIRCVSDPSHANGMLATGQKSVAENGVANGLYSEFSPMSCEQTPYTMTKFSLQQKWQRPSTRILALLRLK